MYYNVGNEWGVLHMKRKCLLIVLLVITMIFGFFNGYAFGHDHDEENGSVSVNFVPDKSVVKRNEFVTFTLRLSDIDIEGGVSKIQALLKYDLNAMSLTSDMFAEEGWTLSYIQGAATFVVERPDSVTSDCDIATIKFKVNYNTTVTSTELDLIGPSVGNSENMIGISDVRQEISIDLEGEQPTQNPTLSPTISPTTSPTVKPTVTPSVVPTNSPNNSPGTSSGSSNNGQAGGAGSNRPASAGKNTNNDPTTANGVLPKAGIMGYVIPLMVFMFVMAIVAFVNYRNIDR